MDYARTSQYLGIIPSLCVSVSNVLILGLGIHLVLQGQFTVGRVMAFQGIVSAFYSPAVSLITAGQSVRRWPCRWSAWTM